MFRQNLAGTSLVLSALLAIGLLPKGSFAESGSGGAFPNSPPTPTTVFVDRGAFDRPAPTIPAGLDGGLSVKAGAGSVSRPPRSDTTPAEQGVKREVPSGDFSNSPTEFARGQVLPVRGSAVALGVVREDQRGWFAAGRAGKCGGVADETWGAPQACGQED